MATANQARVKDGDITPVGASPMVAVAARTPKAAVFLVSADGALWSEVGAIGGEDINLRQTDSVAELCQSTPAGSGAVVIWDAREEPDRSGSFARLQLHSAQMATIVVDQAGRADFWRPLLQKAQIVAQLSLPLSAEQFTSALSSARARMPAPPPVQPRVADPQPEGSNQGPIRTVTDRGGKMRLAMGAFAAVVVAAGLVYWSQQGAEPAPPQAVVPAEAPGAPVPAIAANRPASPDAGATDERVDVLLERARQAMLDRHYMEPADASALTLYQDVLAFDPANGEARQGLQRIAQILITRVQSNLDDRKFEMALQSLETARSITPNDPRIAPLDARISSLRSELGPAQIQAAINAKNFDKAGQLLDEAARAKSFNAASLNQLRDELGRRRAESNVANLLKLIAARLQQDRLIDPAEDSAAWYLQKARGAGADPAQLQLVSQELSTRLLASARTAIDQHRYTSAERQLAEAVNAGAQTAAVATLQRDLGAAQAQQSKDKADQAALLELASARLAQGSLVEPENDNALHYLNQLRGINPKNAGLAPLTAALQAQLVARARSALDAGNSAAAGPLLTRAAELGSSADVSELMARLAQPRQPPQGAAPVSAAALVVTTPTRLEYPKEALTKGTQGAVSLSFTVDKAGKVTNISVIDATPPGVFDAAAVRALSRTRYKPVLQNGAPVEVPAKVRLVFKMQGN